MCHFLYTHLARTDDDRNAISYIHQFSFVCITLCPGLRVLSIWSVFVPFRMLMCNGLSINYLIQQQSIYCVRVCVVLRALLLPLRNESKRMNVHKTCDITGIGFSNGCYHPPHPFLSPCSVLAWLHVAHGCVQYAMWIGYQQAVQKCISKSLHWNQRCRQNVQIAFDFMYACMCECGYCSKAESNSNAQPLYDNWYLGLFYIFNLTKSIGSNLQT